MLPACAFRSPSRSPRVRAGRLAVLLLRLRLSVRFALFTVPSVLASCRPSEPPSDAFGHPERVEAPKTSLACKGLRTRSGLVPSAGRRPRLVAPVPSEPRMRGALPSGPVRESRLRYVRADAVFAQPWRPLRGRPRYLTSADGPARLSGKAGDSRPARPEPEAEAPLRRQ